MGRIGRIIAAFTLCCSPAWATHVAVVRTQDRDGDGSMGSATLVAVNGDVGIVVTAQHVVRDALRGSISVMGPGEPDYKPAELLAWDEQADLAVLAIRNPTWRPTGVDFVDLRPGQRVTWCGGVTQRHKDVPVQKVYTSEGMRVVTLGGPPSRNGDSGGGMFDDQKRLIGVMWGGDSQVYCSSGKPFEAILRRYVLPSNCPNGQCPSPGTRIVREPAEAWTAPPVAPQSNTQYFAPVAQAPSPPATAASTSCGCRERFEAIEAKLAAISEELKGYDQIDEKTVATLLAMSTKIAEIEKQPGQTGPQGPQGPPGEAASVDIDALATAVAAKLPPIRMIQLDPYTGEPVDDELVYLGDAVRLRTQVKDAGK